MQDPELVITAQEGMQVIGSAVHLGSTSSLKTDRNLMEMPLSLTRVTTDSLCLRPGDDALPVNLHQPQNTDLHPPTPDMSKVCLGIHSRSLGIMPMEVFWLCV